MREESKTWNAPEESIPEVIKLRENFGWAFLTKTPYSVTMKRVPSTVNKKLSRLEKQYDFLSRIFPFSLIFWVIMTIIFLILHCAYGVKLNFGFLFTIGLVISLALDIIILGSFLISLPYRKRLKERILLQAEEYNGKIKTVPFEVNLKQGERNSYQIKRAVYNKELTIDE